MTYDTVIVGGGPAGLCAAINGASEGLKVAILDAAPSLGGQARESSRVENYPLPYCAHDGVTGDELMNGFTAQAHKFGVDIFCPVRAAHIGADGPWKVVTTTDFHEVRAKCVILSMGLSYRRLEAKNIGRFMGRGVYYGVPGHLNKFHNKTVAVIGGANSAGQAVLKIAESAKKVYLVARSELAKAMSTYLIDRIKATENIEVVSGEVVAVEGNGGLRKGYVKHGGSGFVKLFDMDLMFIYIGAIPHTAWLLGDVEMDKNKFILTDGDLVGSAGKLPCETSMTGVFAAGDVRHGQAVKRITGAIGDGITALQSCHRYCSNWKEGM